MRRAPGLLGCKLYQVGGHMLPDTGFLSNASQDLRDLMGRAATEVTLKDGETLFDQGDEGDTLYAVTEGAIELSVLSREGRKLSLDILRPGDMFGEIALFDPSLRTAAAVADPRRDPAAGRGRIPAAGVVPGRIRPVLPRDSHLREDPAPDRT